jgi:hypothetical protein
MQEFSYFLLLVDGSCSNFQPVNLLQYFSFFIEELLQSKFFLLFIQLVASLNFLSLIKSPCFELIVKYLEVLILLRMHSAFNFFLMLFLFLHSQLFLPTNELLLLVVSDLAETVSELAGEPASHLTLNIKGGLLSLTLPHLRGEVGARIDNFVLSCVNIDIILFHLGAELTHHNS